MHLVVILSLILVAVIATVVISVASWQFIPSEHAYLKKDILYVHAHHLTNVWRTSSIAWMAGSILMVAAPFVVNGIILYLSSPMEQGVQGTIFFYSLAALACTIIAYATDFAKQVRCYRLAYVKLYGAILRYEEENAQGRSIVKEVKMELINAIVEGEEIINASYGTEGGLKDINMANEELIGRHKANIEAAQRMLSMEMSKEKIEKIVPLSPDDWNILRDMV